MKKRLSHFAYNERSRSSWTLTIPHFTPLSPIRSTIKTVTYVPGTFVTLVSGPHTPFSKGGNVGREKVEFGHRKYSRIRSFESEFPSLEKRVRGDLWSSLEHLQFFRAFLWKKGI